MFTRAALNYDHPLLAAARPAYALIVNGSAQRVFDAHLGEPGTARGNPTFATRAFLGPSINYDGTADAFEFSQGGSGQKPNAPSGITWLCLLEFTSVAAQQRIASNSSAVNGGIRLGIAAGGAIQTGFSGVTANSFSISAAAGIPYALAVSCGTAAGASAYAVLSKLNGGSTLFGATTQSGTIAAGDNIYNFGCMSASGTGFTGYSSLAICLIGPAPIPSAALADWSADPWAIVQQRPNRRRFYMVGQAAGIAFDAASNSGYQAAASTYTWNHTVAGSDRFLAVDVALLSPSQTVTSINWDNAGTPTPLTFIGAQSTVTSLGRVESWGLKAPSTGTKEIQVNLSASVISAGVAVSYTGVHQTSPTESYNSAQATNVGAADATVTVTPVADNTWLHAALATDDGNVTAGQTARNEVNGAGGSGANEDTGPITPAAGTAMSYTDVAALATWAIGGYALRPTAAASLGGGGPIYGVGPLVAGPLYNGRLAA